MTDSSDRNMIDKIGIIELEGMEFHAFHGVLEHEKLEGNLFIVDFKGEVDMSKAAESDQLEDTLNYALIYDAVAKEMETPSELLEHVAGRIIKAIAADYPQLESFSVRVSKKQPPVAGPVHWSRVTLFHNRHSTEK